MVKVSVIVPAYNVYDYIERCLDSLLNQTLDDIEIIVINDGSTDNTMDKLIQYKKYKNVKIIEQKNSGVASARNRGIKEARGSYIAFVDSDDWVDSSMYENLYNKAISNDFDVAMCRFKYIDDYNSWSGVVDLNSDILDFEEKKKYMINMFPVLWNKIYKRDKIKHILFKDGVWAEDVEYLYRVLPAIDTIGIVKEEEYFYYQREKSESRSFDKRVYDYIRNFNGLVDYYMDNNIYRLYKKELEYCYVRYLYATFVKRASTFKDKKEYLIAVDAAICNVKKSFPNYKKNNYFYKSIKGIYLLVFNGFIAKLYYRINGRRDNI